MLEILLSDNETMHILLLQLMYLHNYVVYSNEWSYKDSRDCLMVDKRKIVLLFQERLRALIARSGENLSGFARRCGLDRSALSQFLDTNATRLPRAETLYTIAAHESVSIDWLLGLSQSENVIGQVEKGFRIEISEGGDETKLAGWHREAIGYKIRYVPTTLPDLLRTRAIVAHEFRGEQHQMLAAKENQIQNQLDYSRRPETDMEVAMPFQRLHSLASGGSVWSGLPRGVRQAQLAHMAELLDELYPTFRLFLYDGRQTYSAPFTVFGPKRAAIYLGDMYLVINSVEQIRELTIRFDHLIRIANTGPDRAAEFIRQLRVT
jgi:transcriptional regulator with XRE-family HTH domain